MKKVAALILAGLMIFSLAACGTAADDPAVKGEGVMTYDEYAAAQDGDDVVIEGYVQGKQSWWDNKASLYLADKDGAYFVYNAACTQEDYAKLENGTKVKVTGKKTSWSGEVEIAEGAAVEIEAGNYVADVFDATALLGNEEELIKHQNAYVAFKGLTVAAKTDKTDGQEYAFFYAWDNSGDEGSDADLYFDATLDGKTYTFNVEYYLCNEETDVYQAVQDLKVGDTIDIEGFLYWYEGQSTQVTALTVK